MHVFLLDRGLWHGQRLSCIDSLSIGIKRRRYGSSSRVLVVLSHRSGIPVKCAREPLGRLGLDTMQEYRLCSRRAVPRCAYDDAGTFLHTAFPSLWIPVDTAGQRMHGQRREGGVTRGIHMRARGKRTVSAHSTRGVHDVPTPRSGPDTPHPTAHPTLSSVTSPSPGTPLHL
jgi:hypothetical protein